MARLKKWGREIENRSDPLVKQVEQLHNFLSTQMPKAVAQLTQTVRTLDDYAGIAPPGGRPATPEKTP